MQRGSRLPDGKVTPSAEPQEIDEAGHCTGWWGRHAFVSAFGDDVVDPLNVGTRWTI